MPALAAIPNRQSNPFATCWTRPGALPFSPSEVASVESCLELLEANQWRGQILGPHGVGKSTLLVSIGQALESRGLPVTWMRAGRDSDQLPPAADEAVLLVDSYECLPRWRRWLWRRRRLVATSHRPAGLPTIASLRPTLGDAMKLFEWLTADRPTPVLPGDLARSFASRRGNVREVWFDLYDLHERRTRCEANTGANSHAEGPLGRGPTDPSQQCRVLSPGTPQSLVRAVNATGRSD